MAWMLQPKSFYQAMRPNFYTVAYRRSGAYKGMGSLGQASTDTSTLFNLPLVGPYTVGSPAAFQNAPGLLPVPAGTTVTPDLTQYTPWIIVFGLVVLLAMKK